MKLQDSTQQTELNNKYTFTTEASLGCILQPLPEWFPTQGHVKPFSQESVERVQTLYSMPTTSFPLPSHQHFQIYQCSVLWWTWEKNGFNMIQLCVCSEREYHWAFSLIRVIKWQHYCMTMTHYQSLGRGNNARGKYGFVSQPPLLKTQERSQPWIFLK